MFKIMGTVLLVFVVISLLGACDNGPIDTTAPVISVTGVEDGEVYNTSVTPQISANEEVTWDIGLTQDGTSINYEKGDTIIQVGEYVLKIKATDSAGNQQIHDDISFEISKPDLVFGDNGGGYNFWWDIDAYGNLIIYVVNDGSSTAGESTVEVYFSNDDRTEYISTPSIEPGENVGLPGVEMPSVGGGQNIYFDVILDYHDDVDESDETNNEDSDYHIT